LIRAGGGVDVIGSPEASDTKRLRQFLRRNGVPHAVTDPAQDRQAASRLRDAGANLEDIPVVLNPRRPPLANPTNAELAERWAYKAPERGHSRTT
jgi:thioredoxin reductase (NADPH)